MDPWYVDTRMRLLGLIPGGLETVATGSFWTISPEGLRFRHGRGLADLKVPYHLGSGDESIIRAAVMGLAALLKKRYEEQRGLAGEERKKDGGIYVKSPPLRSRTMRLDIFTPHSLERKLVARILESTPYVDSGLLHTWLDHTEAGGRFVEWLRAMMRKARNDELRCGLEEQTSYLALLVLLKALRKHLLQLRDFRIKGLVYDKIDRAVGLVFFNIFYAIIDELTGPWREDDAMGLMLRTAISPRHFVMLRTGLLGTSHNPYLLSSDTLTAISALLVPLTSNTESVDVLVEEGVRRIRADRGTLEVVLRQVRINRLRRAVLAYMKSYDMPDKELGRELFELYGEDRHILNLMRDPRFASTLAGRLEAFMKVVAKDRERAGRLADLRTLVLELGHKKSVLGGLVTGLRSQDAAEFAQVVRGAYAHDIDEKIGETIEVMMDLLVDRREKVSSDLLREEYQKGRLYRFSTDKRPMIKALESREEGQLFVDMKDFSRKTHNIKEIAMADFMKEHFFKPILDAAKDYIDGEGLGENDIGIRLTNIPGDAIIFSGGMRSLVALARDIRRIIQESGQALEKRLPPGGGREALERVHRRFEERRASLRKKRLNTITNLEAGGKDATEAMIRLGEEESRLERIYKEELEAAIKHEMEAGLFITYGARAEIIELGYSKGYRGPVCVSIGEKINEASRGTFRHPMVKAYLELLLSAERERRRNKDIQYPFDVYIHTAYTLRMPPELEHAFEKLISGRKLSNAQALSRLITENYLKDFEKIIAGESFSSLRLIASVTDIYNKGQALSDEALAAYIKESRGEKTFYRKIVAREDLHESIQEAFFLPRNQMEFVFTTTPDLGSVEIFYHAGELIFRGFEAEPPRGVYEMLNPEGEFFRALVEHHMEQWLSEAREAGDMAM